MGAKLRHNRDEWALEPVGLLAFLTGARIGGRVLKFTQGIELAANFAFLSASKFPLCGPLRIERIMRKLEFDGIAVRVIFGVIAANAADFSARTYTVAPPPGSLLTIWTCCYVWIFATEQRARSVLRDDLPAPVEAVNQFAKDCLHPLLGIVRRPGEKAIPYS
jgi:predicted membrane protein